MDGLMENPIKMDDLGAPLVLETSIYHKKSTYIQQKKTLKEVHVEKVLK